MDIKTRMMLCKLDNKPVPIVEGRVWNKKGESSYSSSLRVYITNYKIIGNIIWVGYRWSRATAFGPFIGQYDEGEDRVIPSDGQDYLWEDFDKIVLGT